MGGTFRNCCCGELCAAFGCSKGPQRLRATFGAGWIFGGFGCTPPDADYVPGEYILEPADQYGDVGGGAEHCCLLVCRLETWPDVSRGFIGNPEDPIHVMSSPTWMIFRTTSTATTVTREVWIGPEQALSYPVLISPEKADCWAGFWDLPGGSDNYGFFKVYTETRVHDDVGEEPFDCSSWDSLPPGTPTLAGFTIADGCGVSPAFDAEFSLAAA